MLFTTLALVALPQAAPAAEDPAFPPATALEQGLSPDAVAALDAHVAALVDEGQVVGAELLVIKGGRTVLHTAHGWRDREAGRPMEPGGVFCVRSMTKPLVGALTAMLVEDGALDEDDPVAKFLPDFDTDDHRAITIGQLWTHTSGLPMSHLLDQELATLAGLEAVARLGATRPLADAPGSRFRYSDQGTDTLAAALEKASGADAATLVRERLLAPLGMAHSACVLGEGHPLRALACAKYVGSPGQWTRYWSPEDPPLFPVFLGSQGLYATATDYARFLDLFLHKGRGPAGRLLRRSSVRAILTPATETRVGPTGFGGLTCRYGRLMTLWTRPGADGADEEVVVFGHNGSDGTHAWAFPEQDALVLYFTQSRGTDTGLGVEERLGELLLGVPFDPATAAPPLEQYLGLYWEGPGDLHRAIVRDGDGLALEVLGKAVAPLTYVGDDRWKLRPGTVLEFHRGADGEVEGFRIGEHQEWRFTPRADLPTGAEVARRVAAAHGLAALEHAGGVRMTATAVNDARGQEAQIVSLLGPGGRWRVDELVEGAEHHVAFDGEEIHEVLNGAATETGSPRHRELRLGGPWIRFGDWSRHFEEVVTVQELEQDGRVVLVVRCGDVGGPARVMYVDRATWRLVGEDQVTHVPMAGRLGIKYRFLEHHEVGGALLPRTTRVLPAHPLAGEALVTVDATETGLELSADAFRVEAAAGAGH